MVFNLIVFILCQVNFKETKCKTMPNEKPPKMVRFQQLQRKHQKKKSGLGDVRVRAERIKDEMRVQGDDPRPPWLKYLKALSDPELTQPQVGKQLLDSFNYDDSGQSLDPDVKLTSFHKAMEYFAESKICVIW